VENRKTYQDIVILEKTYRINKLDARSACWLFVVLMDKAEGKAILSALGKCSKSEFDEIQSMILKKVDFMDTKDGNTFPTTITKVDGSICDTTLVDDAGALFNLTTEAVMFNLVPFLADKG
jgi:hypothetical protein